MPAATVEGLQGARARHRDGAVALGRRAGDPHRLAARRADRRLRAAQGWLRAWLLKRNRFIGFSVQPLQSLNRGPIGRDDFGRIGAAAFAGLRQLAGRVAIKCVRNDGDALDRAMRMRVVGLPPSIATSARLEDGKSVAASIARSCLSAGHRTVPQRKHRKRCARLQQSAQRTARRAICRLFKGSSIAWPWI